MRREETRLLEWPSEGAHHGLYRSMMIFEHGVPGCEIEEDPGQRGVRRGESPERVETLREGITVVATSPATSLPRPAGGRGAVGVVRTSRTAL